MKRLIHFIFNRPFWQPILNRIYGHVLALMNFGGGASVHTSGEHQVISLLKYQLAIKKPVVFDVGANIGNYSREVIEELGSEVELHCFEPSKKTFETLQKNIADAGQFHLNHFGIGDRFQRLKLYTDKEKSGMASIYPRRLTHFDISMNITEEIEIRRLDEYCGELGISHIHLLKMDVEGNELAVLQGAGELLEKQHVDLIQFEFGGCNIDSRTFFQDFYYILVPNYRIYRILRTGLAEVDQYSESIEVFLTTNYLAVAKKLDINVSE